MEQDNPRRWLRSNDAAAYLRSKGLPVSDKTWRNKRCAGTDAPHKYYGNIPLYDIENLDVYAAAELRDQPAKQQAA